MSKPNRRNFLSSLAALASLPMLSKVRPALAAGANWVAEKFTGPAYFRGDEAYENKRRNLVWQAIKPERYPDRIYEINSEQDIVDALAEARAAQRRVSVVANGHSYAANGIRDDTMVLDISRLREVRIDADQRVAYIQPGIRSAEFAARLQKQGLAFPIAHSPIVGLSGYLLGGGMGWNAESWNNLACFNIRAAEVILASGERVIASADQHADIFWAVQGAGPAFFGLVTGFHLDVFPLPAAIRASTWVYPLEAIDDIVGWMERGRPMHDPKVELTLIFSSAERQGGGVDRQCVVSAICFADEEDEAKKLLAPLAHGAPAQGLLFKEELAPRKLADLFSTSADSSLPIRHEVETCWTDDASEAIRRVARRFASVPSPHTHVFANFRARPTLPRDAAYTAMGNLFFLSIGAWPGAEQDEANLLWTDGLLNDLGPIDKAAYINETNFFRHPERARHCFSPGAWNRLGELAQRYDPDGVFTSLTRQA
jgi:hypothetical protein